MYILVFALLFHSFICPDSIENGWKSIKILKTNKIDAEKVLGKPKNKTIEYYEYDTTDTLVYAKYSTAPCKKTDGGRGNYDVPENTILDLSVFPKKPVKLNELKYSREKYMQFERNQEYFDFEYENDDDGISFLTKIKDGIEYVYSIRFEPRIKNIGYRECTSKVNFEIESGWKGIKTLETNKIEVEKILGKPADSSDYASNYVTEEANIRIEYSSEPCRKAESGRGDYNVPKDTVFAYEVYLYKALKLADFKYDRSRFRQSAEGIEQINFFENENDGIFFLTEKRDKSEYISMITFKPGIKAENLKCNRSEISYAAKSSKTK